MPRKSATAKKDNSEGRPVIGGIRRMKFHDPECEYAKKYLHAGNSRPYKNAQAAIDAGFVQARKCCEAGRT
jgi:hypothetical protein